MSLFEDIVAGGSAGAAVTIGAFFLREGNKLRKEGDKKGATILLTCGTVVATMGLAHVTYLLRK
ncbi:hypothetical protein D9M71_663290 [compost metagenome]